MVGIKPPGSWPVRGCSTGSGLPAAEAERGAASALTGGIILCTCMAMLVGVCVAGWIAAIHRARSTADLAALAAAGAHARGQKSCAAGKVSARANGGELVSCRVEGGGDEFRVTVEVRSLITPAITPGPRWVHAKAIAGNLTQD